VFGGGFGFVVGLGLRWVCGGIGVGLSWVCCGFPVGLLWIWWRWFLVGLAYIRILSRAWVCYSGCRRRRYRRRGRRHSRHSRHCRHCRRCCRHRRCCRRGVVENFVIIVVFVVIFIVVILSSSLSSLSSACQYLVVVDIDEEMEIGFKKWGRHYIIISHSDLFLLRFEGSSFCTKNNQNLGDTIGGRHSSFIGCKNYFRCRIYVIQNLRRFLIDVFCCATLFAESWNICWKLGSLFGSIFGTHFWPRFAVLV